MEVPSNLWTSPEAGLAPWPESQLPLLSRCNPTECKKQAPVAQAPLWGQATQPSLSLTPSTGEHVRTEDSHLFSCHC